MKLTLLPAALLISTLLAACGGGGGGGGSGAAPANSPPQLSADTPEPASPGDQVVLDASASSDPDGSIVRWSWVQAAGPQVALQDADTPRASFTAPTVSADAELAFVLTAEDDDGASSTLRIAVVVEALVEGARFSVSGAVLTSANQAVDSDTNDPANPAISNNSLATAQPIGNPITLGGYINQPGSGEEGRSQGGGDVDDYFSVELLAGQVITLLVADSDQGDADLYLYREDGTIEDFSIETGDIEQVRVAADGRYFVNVFAFSGASNYILAIGSDDTTLPTRHELIPGEVIVSYREDDPASDLADLPRDQAAWRMGLRQRAGGPRRPRLLAATGQASAAERFGNLAGREQAFAEPALRARWETLIRIKRLARSPGVRSASPNYRVRPLATPNDPAFSFQWHYPLIDLPAAWDVTTGSREVVVAVVDTGILRGHPDFQGQLLPGFDFIRDPRRAGDGDGIDPDPQDPGLGTETANSSYHGTHVGGTIAARGDNGVGVAGVAYGTRLLPLRALADDGGTSYDVLQAVRYAAGLPNDSGRTPEQAADIINLSLGGEGFSNVASELYREVRESGAVVVAAAGNEGSSAPAYPAAYAGVIAVSAVDGQRSITGYSNRGGFVDVAAPGGDSSQDVAGDGYPDGVLSTGATGTGSTREFAYTFISGTSMAAPHVSGVIALMKSVNPALTPDDVDRLLRNGALTTDQGAPGRDDLYGHGLIDARRAVNAALELGGSPGASEARLTASATSLSFGTGVSRLDLFLDAAGETGVDILGIDSSEPWLSASAEDVDAAGLGRYSVRVDREPLAPGIYRASLTVRSSANSVTVRVQATVGDPTVADLGVIYILLYDPASDEVVDQLATRVQGGRYRYRFTDVPQGSYRIYAGTDADNDLLICDSGEACGAWLTTDQPATLNLDSDREGIDFPADYLVSLPGVQQAGAIETATKGGLPRQQ